MTIQKSGSADDLTNYRPIAIQSGLAKVFGRIVLRNMGIFLWKQLGTNQYGFVCSRSTSTNLIYLLNYVVDAFGRKEQVDDLYLDFSKAFDSVCRQRLLNKLPAYGVNGSCFSSLATILVTGA